MQEVLKQLFDGDIRPAEQFYPKTEEYNALRQKYNGRYDDLVKKLEAVDKSLSDELLLLIDHQFELFDTELYEMFSQGFRMGAKVMIDVYEGKPLDETPS